MSEDLRLQGMFLGLFCYSCELIVIQVLQEQMIFGAHCLTCVGDPSLKRSSVPLAVGVGHFREGAKYLMLRLPVLQCLDHNGNP